MDIKDLLKNAVENKPSEFTNAFDSIIKDKISTIIDDYKPIVAKNLFNLEMTKNFNKEEAEVNEAGIQYARKSNEYTFGKDDLTDELTSVGKQKDEKKERKFRFRLNLKKIKEDEELNEVGGKDKVSDVFQDMASGYKDAQKWLKSKEKNSKKEEKKD